VRREPTHNTSLRIVETTLTAPPQSQALPPFAEKASLTSQQRDTAMALKPSQSVVLASSSSNNEGTLVSLPPQRVEEMNADVHPPTGPDLQDDVRSPPPVVPLPNPLTVHTPTKERHVRFNPDPVTEVLPIPSPAYSTSPLAQSPGPSTTPPLPYVKDDLRLVENRVRPRQMSEPGATSKMRA
jgi:hypothetical protein